MSDQQFRDYREKLFRLYAERRYAEALAHVEQGATLFPEQWTDIAFWKGCLAARVGDASLALRIFRDAAENGWWWSETGLRRDVILLMPAAQSLRGSLKADARRSG